MTGERIEFPEVSDAPTVDGVAFEYHLRPGGVAVWKVDHVHPNQAERFDVRSGRLGVPIDSDEWTATPGTRSAVLAGAPHTVRNDGGGPVHAIVEIRPRAGDRLALRDHVRSRTDGETNRRGRRARSGWP